MPASATLCAMCGSPVRGLGEGLDICGKHVKCSLQEEEISNVIDFKVAQAHACGSKCGHIADKSCHFQYLFHSFIPLVSIFDTPKKTRKFLNQTEWACAHLSGVNPASSGVRQLPCADNTLGLGSLRDPSQPLIDYARSGEVMEIVTRDNASGREFGWREP